MSSVSEKNQFQVILEASPMPTIITRMRDGMVKYANSPVASLAGVFHKNLIGRKIPKFFLYPEEREPIMRELAKKGVVKNREIHCKKADGTPFWALTSFTVLEFEGEPSVMAMIYDITECKHHERVLIRRERQQAVLTEAGRVIAGLLDEQQIARKLVDLACKLVDCKSGAIGLIKDGEICFHEYVEGGEVIPVEPDFRPGCGVSGHVLETRKPYLSHDATNDPHVVQEVQRALGFIRIAATPVLDSHGKLFGYLEMHDRLDGEDFDGQDMAMLQALAVIVGNALENARLIKELTEAEQALRESLETIGGIARHMGGVVYQFAVQPDGSWCFPFMSETLERLIGVSADAVMADAKAIFDRVHSEDAERLFTAIERAVDRQGPFNWRGRVICLDGKVKWFSCSSEPLIREDGQLVWDGVAMDETRQHDLEEQFRQAQKMDTIGTLAAGVAHNFNNILAGMLGTVYLVREKLQDHPEEKEKLKRVEVAGFRAAGMISQLLIFARKDQIHIHPVALTSFLKDAFMLVRSAVPENIHFTLDVSDTPCMVNGDVTLLQQIFLNLVTNAQHAVAGLDRPEIRVSLDIVEPDDTWLNLHSELPDRLFARLTVEDNGCGIAEELRDKLFDPFFTTKEVGEGTGLGLAMVYGAVQSHDGVIEMESEEGKGSTFHVFLPLIEQTESPFQAAEGQVLEGHGETILLADDEDSICQVSRELLESMGYRVLIATNGEEAISLFEKYQDEIRLAMLDVVMPQLGGVDAALRIRASAPDLPILFQTGYGEEQVLGEMKNLKHCRVVTKPAAIPELSRILHELLERGS